MTRLIAELGLNCNGTAWLLYDTVRAFAGAGASDVKLQVRNVDAVYAPTFLDSPRDSPWGTTQREQKQAQEYDDRALVKAAGAAREFHINLSASCWDVGSVERFVRLVRPPWLKIASPFLTWAPAVRDPLLHAYADTGLPLLISTGMCGHREIDEALAITGTRGVTLFQCTSTYPCDDSDVHLRALESLRDHYGLPVGLSYHGRSPHVLAAAVALGASAIEVHVTLSRALYGSDQGASWTPGEFGEMAAGIASVERAMGSAEKRRLPVEEAIATKLRRTA